MPGVKAYNPNACYRGPTELSLKEIGDQLGISRERVRQYVERFRRLLRCNPAICEIEGIEPGRLDYSERCSVCEYLHECLMEAAAEIVEEEAARAR